MPNFSNRWGLPSCRKKENVQRCRGRRGGDVASCRARLEGWILNVAVRSPIWGDVDLQAFCQITGYSREHATRELSNIRRENSTLVFETKIRRKRGSRKQWGVIVAKRKKLRFDRCSLFYDERGRHLHNRTKLGNDGKKIVPTVAPPVHKRRPRGRPRKHAIAQHAAEQSQNKCSSPLSASRAVSLPKNTRLCDNAYINKDSYGIQQKELYGARRDIALPRVSTLHLLRKKAFALLKRLADCHWDNCKITFAKPIAYRYALKALTEGHEERRIISAYSDALFFSHGFAVDQAASTGRVTFFNPSSTVVKARQLLAGDGLTRKQRMMRWYQNHPKNNSHGIASPTAPAEVAWIREQIIASLKSGKLRIGGLAHVDTLDENRVVGSEDSVATDRCLEPVRR